MSIDESSAGSFLSGVERVNLSNLGDEGVFELNSVIKGSMRGKNIVGFLREDIGVVSTEIWDRDFFRFVSLGKLCQEGDLVDLFS